MMKLSACFVSLMLVVLICACSRVQVSEVKGPSPFVPSKNSENMKLFDLGWRFSKGEIEKAETPDFNDSLWRIVDLPHDWSIEDLPGQKADEVVGPFDRKSKGVFYTGFTMGGTGWYRKSFVVESADLEKELSIYFDGVYMEADVWLNGRLLGSHKHGYTPFYFRLNNYLNADGQPNTLAVRVKNIGENSRWYSGSGIYRHVWLRSVNKLNIPVWGVFVTTPEVSKEKAQVNASVLVANNGSSQVEFILKNTIENAEGTTISVAEKKLTAKPGEKTEHQNAFEVSSPSLWSIDHPVLYKLKTELIVAQKVVDTEATTFGIRSISFSPEKGFLLNGEKVLLKGGCIHHDNGALGSAAFDRADIRRIENLKANGFNAIRTSHNPPSQGFLDACDRMGMVVMDEAFDMWENPKRPDDYHQFFKEWHKHDLQSIVMRDRNHPSVILWSIGNEIKERADSSGLRIAKDLIRIIKDIDQTRPVTEGICEFWEAKGRKWEDSAPAYALLDVCGYNYVYGEYEKDHKTYPERVMMGTESFAMSIYENWKMAQEKPYVIGDFVWTGMDYIGEAGIGQVMTDSVTMCWPWIISNCGDIDLIGFKKPQAYYRDVVWDRSPLEMEVEEIAPAGKEWKIRDWGWRRTFRSWNWPGNEGKSMKVYVYSKCDEVRLQLNGQEVETQKAKPDSKFTFVFNVPYAAGELKATGYSNGKEVATKVLRTTGPVEKITVSPDRKIITTDRNDLAYFTVELVDKNGDKVPDADAAVQFKIEGEAQLAAVDNGNPRDPKSFQTLSCKTYQGRCMVIVRPTGKPGKIVLTARCNNLSLVISEISTQ
jgi:beta-galactosidase